jgi:hypothetical protein
MLERFPEVDGIVMDSTVDDMPLEELIVKLKTLGSMIPIILIRSPDTGGSPLADCQVESFQPGPLLELLQKLQPEKTRAIEEKDERLAAEDQ